MSTIVAYTYGGDIFCPAHITNGGMPMGTDGAFDGWALEPDSTMTVEENLDEIALAFGVDRQDETSFDSIDFPKVVFDLEELILEEECHFCFLERRAAEQS